MADAHVSQIVIEVVRVRAAVISSGTAQTFVPAIG
jgi:hypothetical protein